MDPNNMNPDPIRVHIVCNFDYLRTLADKRADNKSGDWQEMDLTRICTHSVLHRSNTVSIKPRLSSINTSASVTATYMAVKA